MEEYLELVEGSFTQEHLDKQKNQNPYVAYSIKDNKVIYTIVPNEEGTMYTIYRVISKDISNCTYNMVDLGLSVKWADRNVGATSPEHYGSYFQWGDTNAYTYDGVGEITAAEMASLLQPLVGDEMEVTKDNVGMILEMMGTVGTDLTPMGLGVSLDKCFNWENYFDISRDENGNPLLNEGGNPISYNKYNHNGGLTVLKSNDDAATVHMGTQYRMPTSAEIRELTDGTTQSFIDIDGNEYDRQYVYDNEPIEQGKLKGVKFTGSNGNSIFIPAGGNCNGSLLGGVGMNGELWSSSLYGSIGDEARYLNVNYGGDANEYGNYRYCGQSVRGVQS
jgi:hypothetical protein